jgi:membrane protein insertase Oxa1/YidC/SpoIIIJ
MSVSTTKAYQQFKMRVRAENVMPCEMFFMTGVTGWTIPSGVLVYDTSSNKLLIGTGSSAETVTSS